MTRLVLRFILWALALLGLAGMPAQAVPGEPFVLGHVADGVAMEENTGHLIDAGGLLTLKDVRTPQVMQHFAYTTAPVMLRGGTQAVWFMLRFTQLQTQSQFNDSWVLSTPYASISDLQFYGPFATTGEERAAVLTGSGRPYATRPLGHETFVMPLKFDAPGEYVIYVRAVTKTSRALAFKFWDVHSFQASSNAKRIFDGLCYGVVIGMLIYNLMLFLVFRDRTYALYVALGAAALLSLASFNGHLAHYLLPQSPVITERANTFLPAVWIALSGWFAYAFLALDRFAPWTGRLVLGSAVLGAATAVLAAMGMLTVADELNEHNSLVGIVAAATGAIMAQRQGFRPAGLYLWGQIALFLTVFMRILIDWGWMDWPLMRAIGLQAGVAIEVVVFATALSSRIRALHSANQDLSRKTAHLVVASETDPLTGVANRAGLVRRAQELLVNSSQRTLVMIDLDKFKPINDLHGHAAGDAMLVEIAKRLRAQVRPSDVVARMGGDEFAILFSEPNDRATLGHICNRILAMLVQPLQFEGNSLAVGGSLGIARYPADGASLDDLLQAADVAMYHVKKNGRGSYAFFEDLSGKEAVEAVQSVAKDAAKTNDAILFDA